jgi:hypothetical protein
MTTQDHLRGPWQAVISARGDAYDGVRTALIELGEEGEVDISVRRGSAAGWVVLLSGDKPVFDEDDPVECETHEVHAKGTIMSVSCRAAHLLGISYDWRSPIGNPLFAPALSRAELGVRVG